MKPERAEVLLHGLIQALDAWTEECRALTRECPQAAHLCAALEQTRTSLKHLITDS